MRFFVYAIVFATSFTVVALLIVPLESWLRSEFGGRIPGANLIVLGIILVLASRFMKHGIASFIGAARSLATSRFAR